MSRYTTDLKTMIESQTGNDISVQERIEQGRNIIFNFEYDLFDEEYKPIFEKNFIMRYYRREIGVETTGLFKLNLQSRLSLLLPKYNKLYESVNTKFNVLENTNITETLEKETEIESLAESLTDSESINSNTSDSHDEIVATDNNAINYESDEINSDYPQAQISVNDYANGRTQQETSTDETRKNETLSNAFIKSDTTGTTKNNNTVSNNETNVETYTLKKVGNSGLSNVDEMIKYRQSLTSVDEMLINELKDLFMMIF